MAVYSYSKLNTFKKCPLKFKFRYIDKIIPKIEKTIEAHLGSAVHETLEWIYRQAKKSETKKQIPSLDDVIVFYSKTWEKNFTEKIVIVNEKLTFKDYYSRGIQFLIDYYKKHYPFDDGTIEIEKKITLKLDSEGKYEIIGYIDRLSQNIHTGEFEIHDYKTGSLPLKENMKQDEQLSLYAIAVKEMYGKDKEVVLSWHYLAYNKKISLKRTNEELDKLKKETLDLIKKIESSNEFPPVKSVLCKWCEYLPICPSHNEPEPLFQKKELNKSGNYQEKYPTASKYIKD